jgi:urease accessory protein UreF
MSKATLLTAQTAEQLLGELHPLAEQLGSAEGLASLTAGIAQVPRVESLASLQQFLQKYKTTLLFPLELPAIHQAFVHIDRYEVRELIVWERGLADQIFSQELAAASRRVGRNQLRRLRHLRDQRLVQRYIQAVEKGEAHGWHTVVYALVLHLFSLPIRQGLASYAHQTLRGFVESASRRLALTQQQRHAVLRDASSDVNQSIEAFLSKPGEPSLQIIQKR